MKSPVTMSILRLVVLVVALFGFVLCQDTDDEELAERRCGGKWWQVFGNECYYHFRTPKSWHGARKVCKLYGTDLVSIASESENDFVTNLTRGTKAWIGLQDKWPPADMTDPREKPEDQWVWTDKGAYNYTNWADEQPSGLQDCVQINWGGEGKWDDEDYWAKLSFVCEKEQTES